MDFGSDNAAGVHPAVLEAVLAAAGPEPASYDADRWSTRLDRVFSDIFETEVKAFAVPSGTSANGLGLASAVPPYGGVWCHADAHIEVDEAGAVGFYTGGASLMLVPGEDGKLTVDALDKAAARRRADVHQVQGAALSLTQATEWGTAYSVDEVTALAGWARARGLAVQMDGARFANALVHLGATPAELTWRAGVDILSFGCIKNGGMTSEALLLFRPELAASLAVRRKRAGLMPSKGRFAAAQLIALVESGAWLENARAANRGAARIAAAAGRRLLHPTQANEVFLTMTAAERELLRAQGFRLFDWELAGPDAARFVVRWDQSDAAIDAAVAAIGRLG